MAQCHIASQRAKAKALYGHSSDIAISDPWSHAFLVRKSVKPLPKCCSDPDIAWRILKQVTAEAGWRCESLPMSEILWPDWSTERTLAPGFLEAMRRTAAVRLCRMPSEGTCCSLGGERQTASFVIWSTWRAKSKGAHLRDCLWKEMRQIVGGQKEREKGRNKKAGGEGEELVSAGV